MAIGQLPSGLWQIDYRADGIRRRESGFRNRREAEKALALTKSDIIQCKYSIKPKKTLLFENLGNEYLSLHSKPRKKSWQKDEQYFKRLKERFGKIPVDKISALDIERFKFELLKEVGNVTVNRHLALMSSMYNWAIRMSQCGDSNARARYGCILQNPVKFVKKERERARTRILWQGEEEKIKDICLASGDYRLKDLWDLLQFALNTGMRKSEQLTLRWEHVNLEERVITLKDTKNGESRIVPLNDSALEILLKWQKRDRKHSKGYIFTSFKGERFISIHKGFGAVLKKAKIEDLHWHDLRGTFCTRLDMLGVGDKVKQEIMGHKTSWMTNRYTHPTPKYKMEAVQRLCRKSGHILDTLGNSADDVLSVSVIN